MKKWALVILTFASMNSLADPHYVQALHPYWGDDERFLNYLEGFSDPVNVNVDKYDGKSDPDVGEDWYIYVYVIRHSGPSQFALNLACPNAEPYTAYTFDEVSGKSIPTEVSAVAKVGSIASDPVQNNREAEISDGRIIWPLNTSANAQAMWFYSQRPPVNREYELSLADGNKSSGVIDGPACEG